MISDKLLYPLGWAFDAAKVSKEDVEAFTRQLNEAAELAPIQEGREKVVLVLSLKEVKPTVEVPRPKLDEVEPWPINAGLPKAVNNSDRLPGQF